MGLRTFLGLKKKPKKQVVLPPFPAQQSSTSQMHQDSWIVHETNGKRGGFFVEIGAFDGLKLSNSFMLEKQFGWSGILVEPNPTHTIPILSRRSAKLCTRPVDDKTGNKVAMRFMINDPEISSLSRVSQKDMHAEYRNKEHVEIEMESIDVNELLTSYGAPSHIDYISIDTEGNEIDILSCLDFDRFSVDYFSIEHNFTEDEAKIDTLLFGKGYERVHKEFTTFDAWYRKLAIQA